MDRVACMDRQQGCAFRKEMGEEGVIQGNHVPTSKARSSERPGKHEQMSERKRAKVGSANESDVADKVSVSVFSRFFGATERTDSPDLAASWRAVLPFQWRWSRSTPRCRHPRAHPCVCKREREQQR
eukprot:3215709-Pleurochrysis_carterae.AAC.1